MQMSAPSPDALARRFSPTANDTNSSTFDFVSILNAAFVNTSALSDFMAFHSIYFISPSAMATASFGYRNRTKKTLLINQYRFNESITIAIILLCTFDVGLTRLWRHRPSAAANRRTRARAPTGWEDRATNQGGYLATPPPASPDRPMKQPLGNRAPSHWSATPSSGGGGG